MGYYDGTRRGCMDTMISSPNHLNKDRKINPIGFALLNFVLSKCN
jgi:hypothetical protein